MKLRSILNEIKLVPHNRILLKKSKFSEERYYFETESKLHEVYLLELLNNKVKFWEWENDFYDLIPYLNSKKIKYEIINTGIYGGKEINIDAKYFITPDSINEVKQIRQDKVLKLDRGRFYLKEYVYLVIEGENEYFIDLSYFRFGKLSCLLEYLKKHNIPYEYSPSNVKIPKKYIFDPNY